MKLKLLISLLVVFGLGAAFTLAPSANADTSDGNGPNKPSFITVGDVGPYVSVVWRQDTSFEGVNIYRDGTFVKSVNMPGNVFNDPNGNTYSKYELIGYDGNGNYSEPSPELKGATAPGSPTFVRWHKKVVQVRWAQPLGATSFQVYMDNRLQGTTTDTTFVHYNTVGNDHRFTIVALYPDGRKSPASVPAMVPSQLITRNKGAVQTGETQEFTQTLTEDREFRGTITVNPDTGISIEGNVYDGDDNDLGTFTQTHDGTNIRSTAYPIHDPMIESVEFNPVPGDPTEFAPTTTLKNVGETYPDKPRQPRRPARQPSGGGGDSGDGDRSGPTGDGSDPNPDDNASGADAGCNCGRI